MTYLHKKRIANHYLMTYAGICWDDLPDLNSLHWVNCKEDVICLCKERLNE